MVARAIVRQAALRSRGQNPRVVTIAAPVGGWNARDSLDQMPETDAVTLDNWFPDFGSVRMRRGFSSHATGVGAAAVETLAEFQSGTTRKLLAASSTNIYDATSAGTASSLGSGFTSGRWQHANMNGTIGFVNGADAPQVYDGSTLSAMTIDEATGEDALTVANLIGINVFKSRSYFWENNSQSFWYSAVNTLGGELTEFPLGRVGTFGGKLLSMITWTRDGGSGVDDLAVFVMSSGEVIIYQGSDPGSAADWALIGIFRIGGPVNIRAIAKVGGDAIVATRDGYTMLSKILPGARGAEGVNVSDKIVNAVLEQTASTGSDFGWQVIHHPLGRRMLVNYPTSSTGVFQQHVVNLATGAWCRFKGMNASSWSLYNDELYFGGAGGIVYKADTGVSDANADIAADGTQAWTYLGQRGLRKHVTAVRPLMDSDGTIPLSFQLRSDFDNPVVSSVTSLIGPMGSGAGSAWDEATWDESSWASEARSRTAWLVRGALGYAFSPRVRVSVSDQSVSWNATSYMVKPAGIM